MISPIKDGDKMLIHKSYKFRLYPNKKGQEIINKTLGCTRLIYNYYLDKKQRLYEEKGENISIYECIKDIPNCKCQY